MTASGARVWPAARLITKAGLRNGSWAAFWGVSITARSTGAVVAGGSSSLPAWTEIGVGVVLNGVIHNHHDRIDLSAALGRIEQPIPGVLPQCCSGGVDFGDEGVVGSNFGSKVSRPGSSTCSPVKKALMESQFS